MKRLAILLLFIPLLFTGCTKDPYADFTASQYTVDVGNVVYFTNRSMDAHSYEWDFGDGYSSHNFNVSHYWDAPGIYTVTLTAFGKDNRMDVYRSDITVQQPLADLEIVVKEYTTNYVVPNISVILYPTLDDWNAQTNAIGEEFTASDGSVVFTGLNAGQPYYVDVYSEYYDNYQLANEDVKWIETQVLVPGVLNSFFAYVDYYPPSKKSAISRKETKVLHGRMGEQKAEPRLRSDKK